MRNIKIKRIIIRTLLYILLGIMSFNIFFPIYLLFVSSLKENNVELRTNPIGFPYDFKFDNYIKVFNNSFLHYNFGSSALVTVVSIVLLLVMTSFTAYALSKYKFRFNGFIYGLFIVGLFLPIRMGTINILRIILGLNLYNNLLGLILIEATLGIPMAIFILTGFIKLIPEEISNAARIDGCSEPIIFIRVIVPLLRPAIVTIVLLNVSRIWNDFWFPLLLLRGEKIQTVPLALSNYIGEFGADKTLIFTYLNIAAWPLIILYLILSRQYISGLTSGAVKG